MRFKINRVTIFIIILISFFIITACGTTKSAQIAHKSQADIQERQAQFYNKQSSAPKFKQLKQYTVTERSQYLHNLLSAYNRNPDMIPAKLVDPMIDDNAKIIADEEFLEAKLNFKKMRKEPGMSAPILVRIIKSAKKNKYDPFWLISELPLGAKVGIIRQRKKEVHDGKEIGGGKFLYIKFIPLKKESLTTVMDRTITDIDTFLLQDKGWTKKGNQTTDMYEMLIKNTNDIMNLNKQLLTEITGNKESHKKRRKHLEFKIHKNENQIASYKKIVNNGLKNKIIYEYWWKSSDDSKKLNLFTIAVEMKSNHVMVFYGK